MMNEEKICTQCKKIFQKTRETKFCSKQCYQNSRKVQVKIVCAHCNSEFEVAYRFRSAKYCSKACSNSGTKKIERQQNTCLNCQKKFESLPRLASKYCCYACFLQHYHGKDFDMCKKQCETCSAEFEVTFVRRNKKFCSRSCAVSGKRNGMYGKRGTMRGKVPWAKGKTKHDSEILLQAGLKISHLLKGKFERGELSNAGSKNPMFGRTADTMTPETIEKYRKAATDRIQRGVSGYCTRHVTGTYTSTKMMCDMRFKSSWEHIVMMKFDCDPNISEFWYEPEVLVLADKRRAIPDFLVRDVNGNDIFYEVKPTALQQFPQIAEKLQMTKTAAALSGREYRLIGNDEIENFKKDIQWQKK